MTESTFSEVYGKLGEEELTAVSKELTGWYAECEEQLTVEPRCKFSENQRPTVQGVEAVTTLMWGPDGKFSEHCARTAVGDKYVKFGKGDDCCPGRKEDGSIDPESGELPAEVKQASLSSKQPYVADGTVGTHQDRPVHIHSMIDRKTGDYHLIFVNAPLTAEGLADSIHWSGRAGDERGKKGRLVRYSYDLITEGVEFIHAMWTRQGEEEKDYVGELVTNPEETKRVMYRFGYGAKALERHERNLNKKKVASEDD